MTVNSSGQTASIAVCICTRDRVDILKRCLHSIAAGSRQPDIVYVSDDSTDGTEVAAACKEFTNVHYIRGPRRGLCANRNAVIRGASTTHVSLMDDDAVMSEHFIEHARELANKFGEDVIFTGVVHEAGSQIIPRNPSFLGHFQKEPNGQFENINLNCNLFPRRAFDLASFDEAIGFGYEDMDLCSHLLSVGFRIQFESRLENTHMPPPRSAVLERTRYLRTERARFYTSVKRYMLWKKSYLKLLAYLVVAPAHRMVHAVKSGLWFDLKHCIPDIVAAIQDSLGQRAKLKPAFRAE